MRLRTFIFVILLSLLGLQFVFGQKSYEFSEQDQFYRNLKIYDGQNLFTEFNKYSKKDLISFSEKFDTLSKSKLSNWEDIYSDGVNSEVGLLNFIWTKENGFVSYYVYTCQPSIRSLNFGDVVETDETLKIIPHIDKFSSRKNQTPIKYVKVKWSGSKFLVEEDSLLAFAEKAAGIYIEPKDEDKNSSFKWTNYWASHDFRNDLIGLPIFPQKYKEFERKPIKSKILSVGKRTVDEKEFTTASSNTYYPESAWYEVNLEGGKNLGIKEGMEFFYERISDKIRIIRVNSKSSLGLIQVDIDENKNDRCTDDKGNSIKCPKIQIGDKIETLTGLMYY